MKTALACTAGWIGAESASIAAVLSGHVVAGIALALLATMIACGLALAGTPGVRIRGRRITRNEREAGG